MAATHREHTLMRSLSGALLIGGADGAGMFYDATSLEVDSDGGVILANGLGFDNDKGLVGWGTHAVLGGAFHVGLDLAHATPDHIELVPTLEVHGGLYLAGVTVRVGPFARMYERQDAPDSWCAGLLVELAFVERQRDESSSPSTGDRFGDFFHSDAR
jgi:hypothetical protein